MDHSTDQTESSTPLASANAVDQEAATDNTVLTRGMDLDVFNAAKEGKTDVLKRRHHLDEILTPTKNTVLHIYIASASSPNFVEPEEKALMPPSVVDEIIQMCPTLLSQKNESGETALHIAARHGRADTMRLMNVLKRNGAASGHRILSENNHDGQKLKENKGGEVTETKKNIRESHLIVATLVATVSFAAGITMPGGYYQSSDQGNAMSNVRLKMGKSRAAAPKRTETKLKTKSAGASKRTSKKAGKDPNKPKRPASAFFVFMEDFREKYKKEHPNNKSVAAVGKAGGDKWKSLSDAEKAPYVAKAEKRKTEYNKTMQAYNKSIAEGGNGAEEEESDKSKSEVNNEEEEDDESAEDEDDDE
ncbi:hypothetical protein GBA52_025367 [Prunus armeniaca]|nr:hypothetical protein GBA52_025367 [Prunus armeniaca]